MNNTARRVHYVSRRFGLEPLEAGALVRRAYRQGTADDLLTPAQRRRVRHKRGGGHFARQHASRRTARQRLAGLSGTRPGPRPLADGELPTRIAYLDEGGNPVPALPVPNTR